MEFTTNTQIRVRFNETDSLGIVWHGNYITYFEDGREDFGRKNGLTYLDVKAHNYVTPIVSSTCKHLLTTKYGEVLTIETTFVNTQAAKLIFQYKIFNEERKIVCTGETIQVFLNLEGELSLNLPPFFAEWKKRNGLLD